MTNWGRDDFVSDLTPDENSVQVLAFMQLCAAAPTGVAAVAVTGEIAYGASGTQSNTFDVDVSANTVTPVSQYDKKYWGNERTTEPFTTYSIQARKLPFTFTMQAKKNSNYCLIIFFQDKHFG